LPLEYEAGYSDGRTAARQRVTVRFGETALIIDAEDGGELASWPFAAIALVDEVRRAQPIRLTTRDNPEARLTIDDPAVQAPLFAFAPQLRAHAPFGGRHWRAALVWGGAAIVAVALFFLLLPSVAEPVAALVPIEWEAALGAEIASGFAPEGVVCSNDAGITALQALVERLAAGLDTPYSFSVKVSKADMVNALAAPGGHIVVFKGLLDYAASPDEVAGVLAHEMGHVVERHAMEGIVRAVGIALTFEVLIGDLSGVLALAAQAGEILLAFSYSRDDEAEADAVGVAILAGAGIGADGLADFLVRLEKDGLTPGDRYTMISTHPPSAARAAAVRAASTAGGPSMSDADWAAIKAICD
jgi:predicted Zn-dependent protease